MVDSGYKQFHLFVYFLLSIIATFKSPHVERLMYHKPNMELEKKISPVLRYGCLPQLSEIIKIERMDGLIATPGIVLPSSTGYHAQS